MVYTICPVYFCKNGNCTEKDEKIKRKQNKKIKKIRKYNYVYRYYSGRPTTCQDFFRLVSPNLALPHLHLPALLCLL